MPAAGNSHCIIAPLAATAAARQRPKSSKRADDTLPYRIIL